VSLTPVSAPNSVRIVVKSAYRRRFQVVQTEQLSSAVTLVLCGAILMLLFGTQILNWYWLALLATIGLAFVAVRVKNRQLTRYRVAQILDQRLQLSDTLSTAWFLLTHADIRREPVAHIQIQKAECLACGIRTANAFPFSGRRSWALTGALAAAGFGLFAVRYLVTNTLSLREPLVPVHFESMVERLREALPEGASGEKSDGSASDPKRERASGAQQNDAQRQLRTPGSDQPGTPDPKGQSQVQAQSQSADAKSGKPGDAGTDPHGNGASDSAQARAGEHENGQPTPPQTSSTKELATPQTAGNQQNSNGLLNRMRDALSDLMAKMRQSDSGQRQGENSRASNEKKSGEQLESSNEQGSQFQQDPTNQQARQQQASQGQGQTTEKAQSSQGANQLADKKGSDSQSGIGRQDGDKSLKEAEEQKAMGKLADIIGKRSASVTGDMTVETGSGKQQLQTRFTGRMGFHSDTGGEIDRDEIPVEFQPYVRAYMEQIRKQQTKAQ
jgi:hypothetical protein